MVSETVDTQISLLPTPWGDHLSDLLAAPKRSLLLASPFLTRSVAGWIGEQLAKNDSGRSLQITCLTNVRVESILGGSLELEGLADLTRSFANFSAVHLPALHAKVFIADCKLAIITSGNLTRGGIHTNYEYWVALRTEATVRRVRQDFEGYARLGAPLSLADIDQLSTELAEVRREYCKDQRTILRALRPTVRKKLAQASDRILRLRARGRSNNSIFRETIVYLLSKAPLKTVELHPLIQQLHPDLCDDGVDRIIDGVSFGKRWKHWVRGAQVTLRREGRISFDGQRWHLV